MATSPAPLQSVLVSRTLGIQFANAAPDGMRWIHERQFFNLQVQRLTDASESVEAAVEKGVEKTLASIRNAALTCAAMGLSMNPMAQLVYFIPRRERTYNSELDSSKAEYYGKVPWIITATPSYRGLAWMCTHYAGADDVAAEVVFKADKFTLRGPFHLPDHEPTTDLDERNHAKAIGVYCGIRWPGGRERSEYMDRTMIERIRSMSDRPDSIMWNPNKLWTEGWKKAVVRRAAKLGIQGNPRIDAAEAAMLASDGKLIDGETVELSRDATGIDEQPKRSRRGMDKIREGLEGAETRAETIAEAVREEETAINAQATRSADPVPEGSQEGDRSGAQGAPTPQTDHGGDPKGTIVEDDWFIDPTSKHPPSSIEWWGDQIRACKKRSELERVRLQAVDSKVDTGPDAAIFVELYKKQSRAIREGKV